MRSPVPISLPSARYAVAIYHGGDDPAVEDMRGPCHVVRLGLKLADRLLAGPVALDLQTTRVEGPAAPAVVALDQLLERLVLVVHYAPPGKCPVVLGEGIAGPSAFVI